MKDKAGQMGAGMAWAFAIGSVIVVSGLGFVVSSSTVMWILSLVLIGGAGWAAVYMTKAGTGMGILTMLVAAIIAGIIAFVQWKSMASAGMSAVTENLGQAAKAAGANAEAQKQLALAGGKAAASAVGTFAGILAFIGVLLRVFIIGLIGAIVGGSMKKSALGGGATPARAA
jgi:hypothetical protein